MSTPSSRPTPPASTKPEPAPAAEPETTEATPEAAAEVEVPLNRAERRAKAKQADPGHVGPRGGRTNQGRSARSHTKRQIG